MIKNAVIIGAGPVGLFMVFQLGMLGIKSTVIDVLPYEGGQCSALYPEKPIYDIPAYPKILAGDLITQLKQQIKPFAANFMLGSAVVNIEKTDFGYQITLENGEIIEAKIIIIAAGSGEFEHKKPPLKDIELYEGVSVFYSIDNKNKFSDKEIVIAGGGDSAVDWAVELASVAKHVHVVHRREKFKAMQSSYDKMLSLAKSGNITMHIPFQLHDLSGESGKLTEVRIIDLDNNIKTIKSDYLIALYGLAMNLDKLKNWGLNLEKNLISINPASMQTNIPGIYAIGDVCTYPGKLKLILCGFAEAAIAAHNAYNIIFPDKALHFEYSTSKGIL